MSALFGAPARATSKNLVEFRAGKMTLADKRVTPDARKGSVYVHQSDDGLMHFCWKDRKSGVVEDDLIIFPDDVEYKKVPQCTTGRVYILKFKSSSRKFFFWMQEPKTDKDEEYCTKVNESLNNPPTPGSNRSNVSSSSGLPSELSNLGSESDLQNLLSGMSQQQLISLLSGGSVGNSLSGLLGSRRGASTRSRTLASAGSAPATTTADTSAAPATPTSAPAATTPQQESAPAPAVQLSDLRVILSNMNVPAPTESAASSAAGGGGNVDLSSALTAETLQPVLSNPAFLERLQQFLPSIGNNETLPPAQNLRGTLQSPQFQQALSVFSSALQSGQLAPVISQFNLGEAAVTAAAAGDLEAFVRALQESQPKEEDEDMATE